MEGIPRFLECGRGVAVCSNPAVVHRNIVCRRRSKDLPECRAWKVAVGDIFSDGTADHDGVSVPFVESWNGCRTILGRQCHDRFSSNEGMVYREEDELAPVQAFEKMPQPNRDRSEHVQPGLWEPKGADRRGNVSADIWRQGGGNGRQSTLEHDRGTGFKKGSAVREVSEGFWAPEPASRSPSENQSRSLRTLDFGARKSVWVQRFSSILGFILR